MVLASGQMPYEYPFTIPLRAGRNAWPGVGASIGASGDVLEQGAFVINAELRKWGLSDENLLSNGMKVYTHPDITPSGFDPKPNGDTLEGLVGNVAALADVDNIEHLRFMLNELCDRYANDTDYQRNNHLRSWLVGAYPLSPSGYRRVVNLGFAIATTNATWLRPELNDITGGDPIETTELHWLGGSGVLFDVDMGEIIFQPFPFPGEGFNFTALTDHPRFNFAPFYPSFQKADGSLITLTGREFEAATQGTWKVRTNLDAIGSGKVQFDGYAIRPDTNVRLVNGLDNAWNFEGDGTNDFTLPIQGLRAVNDGNGDNDNTARTYWTTRAQSSGVYRVITDTPKSVMPNVVLPSGGPVSLWPQGGYRFEVTNNGSIVYTPVGNRILPRSFSVTSDGGTIIDPTVSRGYQVFDDCIWMAGRQLDGSGIFDRFGAVFPISPYNGNFMWWRPAERVIASTASNGGDPGHFHVQLGFEPFGASEILRISKVYNRATTSTTCGSMSTDDELTTTVYIQRYGWPNLDHVAEVAVDMVFCQEFDVGSIGNTIVGLTFDGTDYWIASNTGNRTRLTSALVFDGFFSGPTTGRLHRGNGEDLYTITGAVQIGDPLLEDANMKDIAATASGIGKWSISAEPTDITNDVGLVTHDSAKPIRGETHLGHRSSSSCRIHDIIYIPTLDATHQPAGLWILIAFDTELFLLRVEEESTEYVVTTSIELDYSGDTFTFPNADDFPYEIGHFDIS